jgi:hypothetical protein
MGEFIARIGPRRFAAAVTALIVIAALGGTIAVLALGGDSPSREAGASVAEATPLPSATATASPTATLEPSPTPILHAGILDGMPMSEDEWQARKDLLPLAVMIDNTNGAYPHAGLNRADLIYEAFVEGGITRLMAVYWRQDAEKLLPVRSARTPFVTWASELGALYGHAGGAQTTNDANAIGQIVEWGVRDLNAFSDISNEYYYRDHERQGPYDLATSTAYLREAAERLGFAGPPTVESWKFREPGEKSPAGQPAPGIEIDFQGRLYSWQYLQWKWDPAKKRYLRYQFGGPHMDAVTNEQLAFATVVVMQIPAHVEDEVGHVLLDQEGSGPATVFTGGQAYEGTWKKDSREARTRFYNTAGEEIVFERGPIFVEALAQQSHFSFVADAATLPPMPEYTPPPPGPAFDDTEPEPGPTSTTAAPTPTTATETPTSRPSATPTSTPTPGAPTRTPTPADTPTPTIDPTF